MKKILSFIAIFCITSATVFAYTPSKALETKLDSAVIKINGVIENKGEGYREKFSVILDVYLVKYDGNEKIEYILNYVKDGIQEISIESSSINSPNILLIIADDLGLDAMPGYKEGEEKPNMPHIEALMKKGVIFENLWSAPTCTPTRSTILTGKSGVQTDMLQVGDILSSEHSSLQRELERLTNSYYSHGVIGKWHVSDDPDHPKEMGVDYYAGMLSGSARSYTNWKLTQDGSTETQTSYITSKFTDLAIDWVGKQEKPWFLWLAYTAPHTPIHLPPTDLHDRDELSGTEDDIKTNPLPYYLAAIEAMDTEIGRLLSSIPEDELVNTTIIFIGDNGTPNEAIQYPYAKRKAKGSLYQGGVNVPMFVSGYGVTREGEREDTLVQTSDIYATVLDIAETGTTNIYNSQSFKESFTSQDFDEREFVYTEGAGKRAAKSGYTIRNNEYKLIVLDSGSEEFYDLVNDPYENNKLLDSSLSAEQESVRAKLLLEAEKIRKE